MSGDQSASVERRSGPSRSSGAQVGPAPGPADLGREAVYATLVTAVATALSVLLDAYLPVAGLALVYVCGVMLVAVGTRRTVSVYAALLSFLAYNFFFTQPRGTLRIYGAQDVVAVFSFLVAALVCGHLAWRLRAQLVLLRAANAHTLVLQAMGERLARAADTSQVFEAGCRHVAEAIECETVALLRESGAAAPHAVRSCPPGLRLAGDDLAAAAWVIEHGRPAGRATDSSPGSAWWLLPLAVENECLGVFALRLDDRRAALTDEQRRLAEAMVQQISLAADRTRLVHTLERARVESETERLRTALLSSVSHDLRSPLSAVIGAATSLSAYGERMPASDRRELLESIRSEAERLDRYIQNLLDMTRLGSGPLRLERDWVGLDEILSTALARLRKLYPELAVERDLPAALPPLFVHAALVEQALFNVLENAAKFSPPDEPVAVRARSVDGEVVVDVSDRGPGIPDDERRRIFDLFYRAARGDRAPRGSGLGLTIVRGMVGAHGGRVEALAGPQGRGTTIRLTLPISEPPRDRATDAET